MNRAEVNKNMSINVIYKPIRDEATNERMAFNHRKKCDAQSI